MTRFFNAILAISLIASISLWAVIVIADRAAHPETGVFPLWVDVSSKIFVCIYAGYFIWRARNA